MYGFLSYFVDCGGDKNQKFKPDDSKYKEYYNHINSASFCTPETTGESCKM